MRSDMEDRITAYIGVFSSLILANVTKGFSQFFFMCLSICFLIIYLYYKFKKNQPK